MNAISTMIAGWRGYAAAALAGGLAFGAAAWTAQGWRYGEQLALQRAARAEEVAEGQRQAREILERRYAAVAHINERNSRAEWAAYGGMRNAQVHDDRLRADVGAVRQRLHVAAACPAVRSGMSEAGAATGLDHGARPELDPAARSDYFALRAGIQRVTAQLEACQARFQ